MARRTKQDKLNEARIQRAIVGLQIPMLKIPELYYVLEKTIAKGADDNELRDKAKAWVNARTFAEHGIVALKLEEDNGGELFETLHNIFGE